jgi:hypothetical protein
VIDTIWIDADNVFANQSIAAKHKTAWGNSFAMSQSYQTFFFVKKDFFPFFAIKLGLFIVKALFSYVTIS